MALQMLYDCFHLNKGKAEKLIKKLDLDADDASAMEKLSTSKQRKIFGFEGVEEDAKDE